MSMPTIPHQHVTVDLAPLVTLQLAAEAGRRGLTLRAFCTFLLGMAAQRIVAEKEDRHRRAAETAKALRRALTFGPPIDNPPRRRDLKRAA